ncbi:MAG: sigma-54 dependent transcriptional regulator [Proteobacteria bacterium]|nr:sigma-54 dependent transcriptional regulator [Pseudomonadota bacterium]
MFPAVLIVDDEPTILQSLGGLLTDEGYDVLTASNGYEALKIIDAESPDLILLDIWMPGIDGIDTLKEIKAADPSLPIIIITGHGTIETAVKATKLGAFDFIEKPLSIDKIIVGINNALNFRRLEEENKHLRKKTLEKNSLCGNSQTITSLKMELMNVAPTESSVLILGENGTGKELVARTIHQLSNRAEEPLITVNCASISEQYIETDLFGHEKGAVKGAKNKKRGKFELATNGTIFLDEVGDMSSGTQAKLLRVLEEKQFKRLGGSRLLSVDVRIIASTNKNLEEEIKKGNFREDLYFRLNVIPVHVPALRDRKEDLPELIETFLSKFASQFHSPRKQISPEAMTILSQYSWPGNVRELKNLLERLATMVKGDTIDVKHIPAPYRGNGTSFSKTDKANCFSVEKLEDAQKIFEVEYVLGKLKLFNNDIPNTAENIGVTPDYLEAILKRSDA